MMHAAGPAVYVIRCHYRMNQLHESGGSVDCTSSSCLLNSVICFCSNAMCSILTAANVCSRVRYVSIQGVTSEM